MFKLYNTRPTANDPIEVICDYMEFRCILSKKRKISINDLVKDFLKPADEDLSRGIDDVEDDIRDKVSVVGGEIYRRQNNTRNRYPFRLIEKGNVIQFKQDESAFEYLYLYLLFATRLNMNDNKIFKSIDGTLLFEFISAQVAKSYFGEKSNTQVFGTSIKGGFKEKINKLCLIINEGIAFTNHSGGEITENDGKLDFVTWIDFSDKMQSKLIGFGQSKTGTEWERHLTELQPQTFCNSYFQRAPALNPIRMFFIADIPEKQHWYKIANSAGLLFDRLRILDCAPKKFDDDIDSNIKKWTTAAISSSKPLLSKVMKSKPRKATKKAK